MKCLCCGKDMGENPSREEIETGWHASCVKRFFLSSELPSIDLSEEFLERLAEDRATKGYAVPGVQKKLSLGLSTSKGKKPRLTLLDLPSGYILKPQSEAYPALPEAEFLAMDMARKTGIQTVPFALLAVKDRLVYITKRIDRVKVGKETKKLAMEDFCQLGQRLTEDKYRGSYERCASIIDKFSERPGLDLSEFFLRLAFCFVTGNSDMHLKNFSLIETAAGSGSYRLSEAYDLLPVSIILPEDEEEVALTLNGKKNHLRRKDFLAFARNIGLPPKVAERTLQSIVSLQGEYLAMIEGSFLPPDMKDRFLDLVKARIATFRE